MCMASFLRIPSLLGRVVCIRQERVARKCRGIRPPVRHADGGATSHDRDGLSGREPSVSSSLLRIRRKAVDS